MSISHDNIHYSISTSIVQQNVHTDINVNESKGMTWVRIKFCNILVCPGLWRRISYDLLDIGIMVSVLQWSGRPGFNPRSSNTKDSKNGT